MTRRAVSVGDQIVLLEFSWFGSPTCEVTAFDADGWAIKSGRWTEALAVAGEGPSLAQVLLDVAGLSPQEASDLAAASIAGWEDRGERLLDRQAWRRTVPTFAGLIVVFLIAVVGIGALLYVLLLR